MDTPRLKPGAEVVILGTGGFAFELAAILATNEVRVHGCIGPDQPRTGSGLAYLGDDQSLPRWRHLPLIVAIGESGARRRVFEKAAAADGRLVGFVHARAWVAPNAVVDPTAIVYPNATVHAGASLGRGVLVNSNASVGHEARLGDFATVGPGVFLGGRVEVGAGAYLGIGSCTIESIAIAPDSILGAGAVAVDDCIPSGTWVGVPARRKNA